MIYLSTKVKLTIVFARDTVTVSFTLPMSLFVDNKGDFVQKSVSLIVFQINARTSGVL